MWRGGWSTCGGSVVLASGEHEPLKAAVHGLLGGLAAVCLAYNAAAWVTRRERHLAINSVIYAALTGLEVWQAKRHMEAICRQTQR